MGKARSGQRIDDKSTVGEWLDYWLAEKTKLAGASAAGKPIRPTTARVYRQHIEHYLKPQLGSLPLAKLSSEDISAAYDRILWRPGRGADESWVRSPCGGSTPACHRPSLGL